MASFSCMITLHGPYDTFSVMHGLNSHNLYASVQELATSKQVHANMRIDSDNIITFYGMSSGSYRIFIYTTLRALSGSPLILPRRKYGISKIFNN